MARSKSVANMIRTATSNAFEIAEVDLGFSWPVALVAPENLQAVKEAFVNQTWFDRYISDPFYVHDTLLKENVRSFCLCKASVPNEVIHSFGPQFFGSGKASTGLAADYGTLAGAVGLLRISAVNGIKDGLTEDQTGYTWGPTFGSAKVIGVTSKVADRQIEVGGMLWNYHGNGGTTVFSDMWGSQGEQGAYVYKSIPAAETAGIISGIVPLSPVQTGPSGYDGWIVVAGPSMGEHIATLHTNDGMLGGALAISNAEIVRHFGKIALDLGNKKEISDVLNQMESAPDSMVVGLFLTSGINAFQWSAQLRSVADEARGMTSEIEGIDMDKVNRFLDARQGGWIFTVSRSGTDALMDARSLITSSGTIVIKQPTDSDNFAEFSFLDESDIEIYRTESLDNAELYRGSCEAVGGAFSMSYEWDGFADAIIGVTPPVADTVSQSTRFSDPGTPTLIGAALAKADQSRMLSALCGSNKEMIGAQPT